VIGASSMRANKQLDCVLIAFIDAVTPRKIDRSGNARVAITKIAGKTWTESVDGPAL
jgi:hypothetical protein